MASDREQGKFIITWDNCSNGCCGELWVDSDKEKNVYRCLACKKRIQKYPPYSFGDHPYFCELCERLQKKAPKPSHSGRGPPGPAPQPLKEELQIMAH